MPASSYQQQKLRVCEVCCAYLGIHDNDRRLADHFGGKLHLGFIEIREKLANLQKSVADRRTQREMERDEARRQRSRSRSKRRSRSRSRSKRSRSRSHRRKRSRSRSRSRRHRCVLLVLMPRPCCYTAQRMLLATLSLNFVNKVT